MLSVCSPVTGPCGLLALSNSHCGRISCATAAKAPKTGQAIELWRIETPSGDRYWELVDDKTHGHEVLRIAFRDDADGSERDDGAPPASN